ncbi:MAG: hypothetical protein PHE83_05220 [Opitutaceae bacterium]|nr:hypothetical protein [Opitutaceae bacterium]
MTNNAGTTAGNGARLAADGQSRASHEGAQKTSFLVQVPSGTDGVARVWAGPRRLHEAKAFTLLGAAVPVSAQVEGDTVLLCYPNDADGVVVRLEWEPEKCAEGHPPPRAGVLTDLVAAGRQEAMRVHGRPYSGTSIMRPASCDRLEPRSNAAGTLVALFGFVALILSGRAESAAGPRQGPAAYEVTAPGITVRLSEEGELTSIVLADGTIERAVAGGTALSGCVARGRAIARSLPHGGVEFSRTWVETAGRGSCRLVERFLPTSSSVRWEVEVRGEAFCCPAEWSAPIETRLVYPAAATKALIWATWSDPRMGLASTEPAGAEAKPAAPADRLVPNPGAAEAGFGL